MNTDPLQEFISNVEETPEQPKIDSPRLTYKIYEACLLEDGNQTVLASVPNTKEGDNNGAYQVQGGRKIRLIRFLYETIDQHLAQLITDYQVT